MNSTGEKKRDVLGPLLTPMGGAVYSAVLNESLGMKKRKKPRVSNEAELIEFNETLNGRIMAQVTKLSRSRKSNFSEQIEELGRQISGSNTDRVMTYESDAYDLLAEGLPTGVTMPINLIRRLCDQEPAKVSIAEDFGNDFGKWAAATILRSDSRAVLYKVAHGWNGSLGSASTKPHVSMELNVEKDVNSPFVGYDDQLNIVVPNSIRSRLREVMKRSDSTGCPVRHTKFSPEGSNYSLIDLGIGLVALTLLDISVSGKGRAIPRVEES